MLTTNIKDYSKKYLENDLEHLTAQDFKEKAEYFHCYVFIDDTLNKIIAVGSIGPYWGRQDESSLFNIFVSPEFQGQGIGKQLIQVLEQDEYFKRAKRIEIPASITGLGFLSKNGVITLKMAIVPLTMNNSIAWRSSIIKEDMLNNKSIVTKNQAKYKRTDSYFYSFSVFLSATLRISSSGINRSASITISLAL
jgi:GNAT superfamily N-acetyltransferase